MSVEVGEMKTVTISSTETKSRTLAMGSNTETSNPYTKNDYFDAKLVNDSGTATLTISAGGTLTLQITGKKVTKTEQTFKIYRNGETTSCSVKITVTEPPPTVETAFTFTGKIVDYSNGASATPFGADWSVTCAGQGTFSIPANIRR